MMFIAKSRKEPSMNNTPPKTTYLKDYTPYPFNIAKLDLNFCIHDDYTAVKQRAEYERMSDERSLYLHGEELEILSIKINGELIDGYEQTDDSITLQAPTDQKFTLEIKTKIYPEKNTQLSGLYKSDGMHCTQCEAEGFRRITYYPDRPDVMSKFTVRIEADKSSPRLLSNGNKIDSGDVGDNRHFAVWQDPHSKPCYLFALVAGELDHIHDVFTTKSGVEVDLYIYVKPEDIGKCDHAMESLKRSMKWDEDVYGLEYDLNIFNIVAVSDFNMGAMENKSLNIFNTALVLADQDTATDQDFMRVEGVIAHEYFHNWSGNRVTCRDWFQLSLKEGLTVFRDQEFSADMNSRQVQRIDDVSHLRKFQFSEDASPLSHPIRPDNYIEINNFYTMTVYEKGAEVIRMLRTILGDDNYYKGAELYFSRHDGQAVTCDDFVQAMEDASDNDLSQFKLWYSQSGTPEVSFNGEYDAKSNIYKITLKQSHKDKNNKPMLIPVSIGLLGEDGSDLIATKTLMLDSESQEFEIPNIAQKPVPSILRGFSAPVNLKTNLKDEDLSFLMVHDSDGFNQWDSGQRFSLRMVNKIIDGKDISHTKSFISSYGKILDKALNGAMDKSLIARRLSIPDVSYIIQQHELADPALINDARKDLLEAILQEHSDKVQELYDQNRSPDAASTSAEAMGQRALQNCALALLSYGDEDEIAPRAYNQYIQANNMADRIAALRALADTETDERDDAFDHFYKTFKDEPLVIDKWFGLQAMALRPSIISDLNNLRSHNDFNIKNPNRARSLFAAFAMNNPVAFHNPDGSGYEFLRDSIIELNDINPQIAARLLTPMREWRRYTGDRQELMHDALAKILEIPNIAPDVFEIASKSLKG